MFPTKIARNFLASINTVGTINTPVGLATAIDLPHDAVDILELRLDAFAENSNLLLTAIPRLSAPLLITARCFEEGGMARLSSIQRAALYEAFIPHASLIDVELQSMESLDSVLRHARLSGLKVIASFHDFNGTPPMTSLSEFVRKADQSGADVIKIATTTDTPGDVAKLLTLFGETTTPLSIMGMGRFGKVSRLMFAQAGSVLNYGFLDAKAQVSGQWEAILLKKRIAEIN